MVSSPSWKMGSNCGALWRDLSQSIHARERAIYRSGHLHAAPTACVRFWNDGPNHRRNSTCNVDRWFHLFHCRLVSSSLIAVEPEVRENNDFLCQRMLHCRSHNSPQRTTSCFAPQNFFLL